MEIPENRMWMYNRPKNKRSNAKDDFYNGVHQFIEFAASQDGVIVDGLLRCPCAKCKCQRYIAVDEVKVHLFNKGFMPNYYRWTSHGERPVIPGTSSSYTKGVSVAEHQKKCIREHRREPTGIEIMERTKKLKTKDVADEFDRRWPETRQSEVEESNIRAENALLPEFVEGNGKKGNVRSQRDLGPILITQASPSTAETPPPPKSANLVELQEHVAALITEVAQSRDAFLSYMDLNDRRFKEVVAEHDEAITAAKVAAEVAKAAAKVANAAATVANAAVVINQAVAAGRSLDIPLPPTTQPPPPGSPC